MAAEGLRSECVGKDAGTSEYIVTVPIEQSEIMSKAAADAIEAVTTDEAKPDVDTRGSITLREFVGKLGLLEAKCHRCERDAPVSLRD